MPPEPDRYSPPQAPLGRFESGYRGRLRPLAILVGLLVSELVPALLIGLTFVLMLFGGWIATDSEDWTANLSSPVAVR